jgi:hypothetical protein
VTENPPVTDRETLLALAVVKVGKQWAIELTDEEEARLHPMRFKTKAKAVKHLRRVLHRIVDDAEVGRAAAEASETGVRH